MFKFGYFLHQQWDLDFLSLWPLMMTPLQYGAEYKSASDAVRALDELLLSQGRTKTAGASTDRFRQYYCKGGLVAVPLSVRSVGLRQMGYGV